MNTIEILKSFCAKNDIRYYMNAPIVRGEFIFATNGHVMARVPKFDGIECGDGNGPKNIEGLMSDTVRDGLATIPALPEPEDCKYCQGKGFAYLCKSCDGEGEFDHDGDEYTCKPCGGLGSVPEGSDADRVECPYCDGTGHRQQRVTVGASDFDRRYLAKLMSLPGCMIAPHPTDANKTCYFTFDGGDGALMPMIKLDREAA